MTGWLCKLCGQTSPVGIGYAAGPAHHDPNVTSCPCGYSRKV